MKRIIFSLAVLGWIASLIVHIYSINGHDVSEKFPYVMLLHVGIFIVWLPTAHYLKRNEEYKQFEKSGFLNRMNPLKRLSIIFKNAPVQIKILAGAGILYMPINFFMSSGLGSDGLMIKEFSGHWMAFYGIAAAAMYPFQRAVVL